ncbi:ionic transporter y4hA [Altererythrobacter sp. FM1]|uniref:Ionic transporter y4hA n=1 Tax=Tsuneonella flava TaxID=2055955 RepID=A0ABX7KBY6_9SPHN|nr:ionic transporter y4hA [Tsuneonella flava]QSB45514.1 ionic transporter y4hA [Tsuneonella flava]ROT97108.1 ionic transporter y4hA [Altererythrobacter sp. FM1]
MRKHLSSWASWGPLVAWLVFAMAAVGAAPIAVVSFGVALAVICAVHHAEIIAHKLGEPFGTLVLALAVTMIEVGLILALMTAAADGAASLARDTVFAAVMIILNGIIGVCLLIGGLFHREQSFQQSGVSAALATICALTVLSLVLPNFTVSEPGPVYSNGQLAFVAIVSLVLYLTFVMVQTVRHREYFLPPASETQDCEDTLDPPSNRTTAISAVLLLAALGAVVLLAKELSKPLDDMVLSMGAPQAVVGVMIAVLVLLPESVAAVRAALRDRIQTSLNLALGSALATIGLSIPAVAALSLFAGLPIALGLGSKGIVLLGLTLLVTTLSLGNGRTTVLQGVVHLVIFGVYLFTTIVP